MLKADVLAHFKTPQAVAVALKTSASAVSQWGKVIPILRAYQLEKLTEGALKVDESLYPKSNVA
jgi:hypothetical protein